MMIQLYFIHVCSCSGASRLQQNEYCIYEPFEAKCFGDEMIVMTSAQYGFMGIGRCATLDFGMLFI